MITILTTSSVLLWISVLAMVTLNIIVLRRLSNSSGSSDSTSTAELAKQFLAEEEVVPILQGFDLAGRLYQKSLNQKPTALFFIALGCPPCEKVLPKIISLYKEINTKGYDCIVVSNGSWQDTKNYLDSKKVAIPVVATGDTETLEQFQVDSFPTYYLLLSNGSVFCTGHLIPDGSIDTNLNKWLKEQQQGSLGSATAETSKDA
jgi:thiol-disulfide isomerase/thioredoxin